MWGALKKLYLTFFIFNAFLTNVLNIVIVDQIKNIDMLYKKKFQSNFPSILVFFSFLIKSYGSLYQIAKTDPFLP